MKRLFLAVTAAVAAAAFTPLAGAAGSNDYVVGAGERATESGQILNHFAVSAQDGPNGVFGNYHVETADGTSSFDVDVKCTYIVGNRALIGGVITHEINRPGLDGVGFAVAFEDNGTPQGGVTPDRVSFNDFFVEPGRTPPMTQADCAAEAASAGLFDAFQPMAAGNVRSSTRRRSGRAAAARWPGSDHRHKADSDVAKRGPGYTAGSLFSSGSHVADRSNTNLRLPRPALPPEAGW